LRDLIDYFVLDALADDIESLEQIVPSVQRAATLWHSPLVAETLSRANVIPPLLRLIDERLVVAYQYSESGRELEQLPSGALPSLTFDDYWFGLTPTGRMVHSAWDPPPESTAV